MRCKFCTILIDIINLHFAAPPKHTQIIQDFLTKQGIRELRDEQKEAYKTVFVL